MAANVIRIVLTGVCLVAALPWVFIQWRFGGGFFMLPALDLAVIAALFVAIDRFCGGQFSCGY